MEKNLRVAYIGCGKRASQFARGMESFADRCEVVAVVDLKEETARAFIETHAYTKAQVFQDHREMLREMQPDLVIACLWTPLHLPIFRDAAEAGVKIFLSEKPMAPSWGESLEMGQIAEETGCVLTFCHQRRFTKGNQEVRRLLREGVFGEILSMELSSPCGLLDCGTHSIDQALSFNNETPARWVHGAADVSEINAHFGVPTELMFSGLIVFENDVRATIQARGPDRFQGTGVRVIATNGLIEVLWDGQIARVAKFDEPGRQFPLSLDEDEPEPGEVMREVIRDALHAFDTGEEAELDVKKALRTTEIIYALYESAVNLRRVELPLATKENLFVDKYRQ